MGSTIGKALGSRGRIAGALESSTVKRDTLIRKEVEEISRERAKEALEKGTKYTDPSALITGFRREEHGVGMMDNHDFLKSEGSMRSNDPAEISQDLIDFMNEMPAVETKTAEGQKRTPREILEAAKAEPNRPLPTAREAPGPRVSETAAKGQVNESTLRDILNEYHFGPDGEPPAPIFLDTTSLEANLKAPEPRKTGSINTKNAIKPEKQKLPEAPQLPELQSELQRMSSKYGLTVDEILLLTTRLSPPEVKITLNDDNAEGWWRTRPLD